MGVMITTMISWVMIDEGKSEVKWHLGSFVAGCRWLCLLQRAMNVVHLRFREIPVLAHITEILPGPSPFFGHLA